MGVLGVLVVCMGMLWMFVGATSELGAKALWVLFFMPYTLYYGITRLPRTIWSLTTILIGLLATALGRIPR